MNRAILRNIPKMDSLLERPAIRRRCETMPRAMARAVIQEELDALRRGILSGEICQIPDMDRLEQTLCARIDAAGRFHLRRVVNATGVVIHTNLGRAPLGEEISRHVADVAAGYSDLEYRLDEGGRGSRYDHVEALLCRLTGAEAALVVNNNAAAVFLMLNTLVRGKTVALSRGELVEIGGSFRMPEIIAQSGAALLEVGTTNKTRLSDYEAALDQGAEGILKVHASNFKVLGFTEEADISQLAALARERERVLLYDLGSGLLVRPEALGLHEGVYVPDAVRQCDVVCFSGDKLLGGPQAGILLGRRALIEAMKKNHLNRMLRIDKLTLAALEAVLRLYLDEKQALEQVPTLQMLHADRESLTERAGALAARLSRCCPGLRFTAEPCMDEPGGGSLPAVELPGCAVAVEGMAPAALEARLRAHEPPIVGRISRDRMLLSLRTLLPEDEDTVAAFFTALGEQP